jgi:hypothetical protein
VNFMRSASLALVLCGCVAATPRGEAVLMPGEVGRAEEGATVKVRGYLVFGSHARQLWLSERAARNNDIEDCVTLVNTLPLREQLTQSSRRIVTITGRAFRDVLTGRVDIGACSPVGLLVERVDT